jgi:hypothetical protein
MRLLLFMLGIFVSIVGIRTRAEAQNYPWRAQYSGGGGGMNCGFATFNAWPMSAELASAIWPLIAAPALLRNRCRRASARHAPSQRRQRRYLRRTRAAGRVR